MPLNESSSSVSVSRRGSAHPGGHPLNTVVWVRGEHDIATRMHLSVTIAQAAQLDDADIVIDLSGVTFMDASTIGALMLARNHLQARSRSLSVRDPSPRAWRVLDLCELTQLVDDRPAPAPPSVVTALSTWVDVPRLSRGTDLAPTDATFDLTQLSPTEQPERTTREPQVDPTALVEPRRALP